MKPVAKKLKATSVLTVVMSQKKKWPSVKAAAEKGIWPSVPSVMRRKRTAPAQ